MKARGLGAWPGPQKSLTRARRALHLEPDAQRFEILLGFPAQSHRGICRRAVLLLGFHLEPSVSPSLLYHLELWLGAKTAFYFIQSQGALGHRVNCRDNGPLQLTACRHPRSLLWSPAPASSHPSSTATYLLHPLLSCRRGPLWWPGNPRVTWKKWWPPAAYVEPRRPDLGGASLGKARSRGELAPGKATLALPALCLCFPLAALLSLSHPARTLYSDEEIRFQTRETSTVLTTIPIYLTLLTSTVNDSASLAGPSAICNYKYINR